MRYQIEDRIDYILDNDKFFDPQQICEILKDEVKPIIQNYLSLEEDIKVRFKKGNASNIFWIEIPAKRIKPFGYIK